MSYWFPKSPEFWAFGLPQAYAAAVWPDLDKLPKDQLLLCAIEKSSTADTDVLHPTDIVVLNGPDDPLIAEVQQILLLKSDLEPANLKRRCTGILQTPYGNLAARFATLRAIDKLASTDPSGVTDIVALRTEAASAIGDYEAHEIIQFMTHTYESPDQKQLSPVFAESLINLCVLRDEPPRADALHLLAQIAATEKNALGKSSRMRRAALAGILSETHPASSPQKDDISAIQAILPTVPDRHGPRY